MVDPTGWSYRHPNPAFAPIENWLCFYPSRVSCFVNGQTMHAQASAFYGGWITDKISGPFKGDLRTGHWKLKKSATETSGAALFSQFM
jgi:hypothetical protein